MHSRIHVVHMPRFKARQKPMAPKCSPNICHMKIYGPETGCQMQLGPWKLLKGSWAIAQREENRVVQKRKGEGEGTLTG